MADPVIATDGHSYDRKEIERWFATGKQTSPMTNEEMPCQTLIPNRLLKSQIAEWRGKSNGVADMVAAVVLADDQKGIEQKLGDLAGFVSHNKAVVQPQTLEKLRMMLQGSAASVQQSLRAVVAECKHVAAGFAARLRDELRDQGLAAVAAAAGRTKLAELDVEIGVAEEQLCALKERRERKAKEVTGLEQVEAACATSVEEAEKELGGYREPLALLEQDDENSEEGEAMADGSSPSRGEVPGRGWQTRSKRKRVEVEEDTVIVAKRQRNSDTAVDFEALMSTRRRPSRGTWEHSSISAFAMQLAKGWRQTTRRR